MKKRKEICNMIIHLKDESIDELIKNKKVIIDFYADWCMPCNMLGENLEEIVEENKTINIIKVNVDEHPDLARQYGVMSIPLLCLYNDNKLEKKHVGFMEKEDIIEWLK